MIGGSLVTRGLVGPRTVGGTWTAISTWTLPAVTLGGNITGNSKNITGVAYFKVITGGYGVFSEVDNSFVTISGGADGNAGGVWAYGKSNVSTPGYVEIYTTNASAAATKRLSILGGANQATATWTVCHQDFGTNYTSYTEMSAPGAGAANTARIYALEGAGDALTDLCAVFQDGTVVVFAEESTPLDSPLFTQPSGVEVKHRMIKPHPGLIQEVLEYPGGKTFVIKYIEYHDADKIAANTGCDNPLPEGWEVTTLQERIAKQIDILAKREQNLKSFKAEPNDIPRIEAELNEIAEKRQRELARTS